MAQFQNHSIEPAKLLTAAVNILHQHFFVANRADAKRLYNEISEGKIVPVTRVKMDDDSELRIDITLDRSEYTGKLNFGIFKQILNGQLALVADRLKNNGDLKLFSDQSGNMIFHIPAIVEAEDSLNVMVLGIDKLQPGVLVLKPQFLDPQQFVKEEEQ